MAQSRKLQVEIIGDASSLQKAFGKASNSSSGLTKSFIKVGKAAAIAGVAVGAFAAVGVAKAIGAASDLGEQLSKTSVVFGDSSKEIHKWSEGLADSFGLSQRAALEAAGTFGNMLVPMGFARKDAASMSKQFVELAADMASFNNASPAETLDALRAGLAGETEPLRRFGVFLNDARIKAQALEMGLYSGKGALDAQAKAAATAAIIMKDTADTQGDFARTSDGLANQQRILKAELENSAAAIGQALMPAAIALLGVINEVIPVVTEWGISLSEAVGPHITTAINALVPTFLNVKQAALELIDTARNLLPTFQAIASPVFSFGVSSLGQSFAAAGVAMYAFHAVAVRVVEQLVKLRAAATGAGLASLISPLGLLTAGVGLLAFAFYKTKVASDDVTTSLDRQRTALENLKNATDDAAHSQQRLRDAKIALKQATLDVTTALQRRNQIEKEGKKGTDEFKQAQLDVERAYSNRKRAELEVRESNEALVTSTRKQSAELKNLKTEAATSTAELGKLAGNLNKMGKEAESHRVVRIYAEEMTRLAKGARNVSEETAKSNPQLSAAAANFSKNAEAAADYARRVGKIPPALVTAIGPIGTAGRGIGIALGQGIQQGINSQVAGIAASAANAVRAAENAARSEARAKSPSELFAAIGYDIGEGMKKGIERRYAALSEAGKTAVDKMISAAAAQITAKRGAFESAFSELTNVALAAFDKITEGFQGMWSKMLAQFDAKEAARQAKLRIQELQAELTKAQVEASKFGTIGLGGMVTGFAEPAREEGEKEEDFLKRRNAMYEQYRQEALAADKAVTAAQAALTEEQRQQENAKTRARLEGLAAQEQKNYEDRRELRRKHFEEEVRALENRLLRGEIKVGAFQERMLALLRKYEVPFKNRALALGSALAEGLTEAIEDVSKAAVAVREAILDALGRIDMVISIQILRKQTPGPGRQHGGPVTRKRPYIVGEAGPELFVPSVSGRIISNAAAARTGTATGGGGTYVFNFPNYVGSKYELQQAMQEAAADWKRRNGGSLL